MECGILYTKCNDKLDHMIWETKVRSYIDPIRK